MTSRKCPAAREDASLKLDRILTEGLPLRRAGPADVAAVRDLTRAAYAKWVALIGREPTPMTADYDRAVAEHIVELWEEDGQLLGLIEVIPAAAHLLIENIAVRPDQQGKGIGGKLLLHAEGLARSLGLNETQLYTNAAFASNCRFIPAVDTGNFVEERLYPEA